MRKLLILSLAIAAVGGAVAVTFAPGEAHALLWRASTN